MKRDVATAVGTIGRRARRASVTMPGPARRARRDVSGDDDRGTIVERAHSRAKRIYAAAVLAAPPSPGATNQINIEAGHCSAD